MKSPNPEDSRSFRIGDRTTALGPPDRRRQCPIPALDRFRRLAQTLDGHSGNRRQLPVAPARDADGEQGYPGVTGASWFGLFAPAKMDGKLADEIAAKVADALRDPTLVSRFCGIDCP